MKKFNVKKIIKSVLEGVLIAAVAAVVVVFIITKINGDPVWIFGRTTMFVMTDSMSPTIEARTYILVKKATADDVEVGDVIVFYSTDPAIYGQLNTHRIVEKDGDNIVTKGDHNPSTDGAYSAKAENIVGKYVRTMPVLTFIGRIVMQPMGFATVTMFLVVFIVMIVMGDVKANLQEAIEKENKEKAEAAKQKLFEEELERLKREGVNADELKKRLEEKDDNN